MQITLTEACKLYGVNKSVIEDWITVSWFPIERVRGQETDCYDYQSQNWRIDPNKANEWIGERVQGVVEGRELFIGYPESPSKRSRIIINQVETDFLRGYLYPNMPPHVKAAVEKAEFDDLRSKFVGGHPRSRWFEAAGGIMGHNALETLKREGDSLGNLVGFEARLYALYIRSVDCAQNKRHPDFHTYVSGTLWAGTFDHLDKKVVQQAKNKYGTKLVRGLLRGSSHWER